MENTEKKQPLVQVKNLCKYFEISRKETLKAVDDLTFDIYKGETVSLVGESGCGKSTTGRTMIKLYNPTSGNVYYDGKDIFKYNHAEQKEFCKKVQMIFQNPYSSLNPRMTVKDIVGEGLKQHGMSTKDADAKVEQLLATVGLNKDHMSRFPHEFSGGQRQRVAMGRAIVRNPKVFLMDEPLSNLDAKLRVQMRIEISKIHQRLGATIIYVTHDQTEAMTLGTRIVVMKDGVVQQVDTPQNLYNAPGNLFVAGFIGSPQMNFIDAKCTIQGDKATLTFGDYSVVLPDYKAKKLEEGGYNGKTVVLGIRPEDISDDPEMIQKNGDCVIESDVTGYELLGAEVLLYYSVAGANMTARVDSDTPARYGDHIKLAFDPHKIHVFDKETELTITN